MGFLQKQNITQFREGNKSIITFCSLFNDTIGLSTAVCVVSMCVCVGGVNKNLHPGET